MTRYLLTLFGTWLSGLIIAVTLMTAMFIVAPMWPGLVPLLGFAALCVFALVGAITERLRRNSGGAFR